MHMGTGEHLILARALDVSSLGPQSLPRENEGAGLTVQGVFLSTMIYNLSLTCAVETSGQDACWDEAEGRKVQS